MIDAIKGLYNRLFYENDEYEDPSKDTTFEDPYEGSEEQLYDELRKIGVNVMLPDDRERRIQEFFARQEQDSEEMVDPVTRELEFEEMQKNKVDFNFIKDQEGFKTKGYVPKDSEGNILGKSGVTIASGFDLGQKSLSDLEGLSDSLIEKLTPYLGKKGEAADKIAANLELSEDEANAINEFAKQTELQKISNKWKEATGTDFSDLDPNKQTVIASVAFQYGSNLDEATPNFWQQVTSGDWEAAKKNLLNFGDSYSSRRKREASLIA